MYKFSTIQFLLNFKTNKRKIVPTEVQLKNFIAGQMLRKQIYQISYYVVISFKERENLN